VIEWLVMCALRTWVVCLSDTPDVACRDSRACAALWALLIASTTAALLFLAEFLLNLFRDNNRSS
jgi:hypothetical protein